MPSMPWSTYQFSLPAPMTSSIARSARHLMMQTQVDRLPHVAVRSSSCEKRMLMRIWSHRRPNLLQALSLNGGTTPAVRASRAFGDRLTNLPASAGQLQANGELHRLLNHCLSVLLLIRTLSAMQQRALLQGMELFAAHDLTWPLLRCLSGSVRCNTT